MRKMCSQISDASCLDYEQAHVLIFLNTSKSDGVL